jgi:nucleolar protein 12
MCSVFDSFSRAPLQYKVVVYPKKNLEKEASENVGKAPEPKFQPVAVDSRGVQTVFVGNIPAICKKKHVKQLFKQHGSVQSVRFRSMKVAQGDVSTHVARRTGKNLVEGSSLNAYVIFSSQSEAEASLCLNGTLFHGRHLRVDLLAGDKSSKSTQRSVFVGNMPFSADEEKLREVFSVCGGIDSVRIVRDKKTGIGKGFGFVTFTDSSGAMFAVKQHNKAVLDGRTLRVCKSKDEQALQEEKQMKRSGIRYTSVKSEQSGKGKPDKSKQSLASRKLKSGLAGKAGKKSHVDRSEIRPGLASRNHSGRSELKLAGKGFIVGKRRPDGSKNRYRDRL